MYNFTISADAIKGAQEEDKGQSFTKLDTKIYHTFRVTDYRMDEAQTGSMFVEIAVGVDVGEDDDGNPVYRKLPPSALRLYPESAKAQKYWLRFLDATQVLPIGKQVEGETAVSLDNLVGAMFLGKITYRDRGVETDYPKVLPMTIKEFTAD